MAGEGPLVAFTILGQAAVGIDVCAGIPLYFSGEAAAGRIRLALVLGVLGLTAAATALSFFHLRHPARAFRALTNVGESWLSREILSETGFAGVTALLAFCEWRGMGDAVFLRALFVLSLAAGLLFLAAMSRLYMLPAVPTWRSLDTPISFALAAAVLGTSGAAVLFRSSAATSAWTRPLLAASLLSIAASFGAAALFTPGHGLLGAKPGPSLRPPGAGRAPLHALRLTALAAAGVLVADGLVSGGGTGSEAGTPPALLLVAGFVVAAAGEVSGRFLFYLDGVGPRQKV